MIGFVYQLQAAGIPVSIQYVMDLYRALRKGLVSDLDQLFLLARLIFVKRVEHFDVFEQVFASFFLGRQSGNRRFDWEEIFAEKPFQEWLREQIESGQLNLDAIREFDSEELLRRFWETLLAQRGTAPGRQHLGWHRRAGPPSDTAAGSPGASESTEKAFMEPRNG